VTGIFRYYAIRTRRVIIDDRLIYKIQIRQNKIGSVVVRALDLGSAGSWVRLPAAALLGSKPGQFVHTHILNVSELRPYPVPRYIDLINFI